MTGNKQPVCGDAQDSENRKKEFQQKMEGLLGKRIDNQISVWFEFVKECLDAGQYIYFVEQPRDIAEKNWYEALYSKFKQVADVYGSEALEKVFAFADVPFTLYPWEIMPAAQIIVDGGTPEDVINQYLDGSLPDDMDGLRSSDISTDEIELSNPKQDESMQTM